jgi:hypothetical protein
VDDFQYVAGRFSVALALTVDPAGNLFVAGDGQGTDPPYHALIQKTSDGGATWIGADDLYLPPAATWYSGIAADPAGYLYAVAGNFGSWYARQSMDGGLSWTTVDAIVNTAGVRVNGVATDVAGNVYAVGYTNYTTTTTNKNGSTTTTTTTTWVVRKGINAGTYWTSVDAFSPNGAGSANAVFCQPVQGVFVTGGSGNGWTTRRSLDGGASWATVDNSPYGAGQSIGADSSGNIYVVGGNNHDWIVRKSSDGGTSWVTVDDFLPQYSVHPPRYANYASAHGFTADSHGNLFVVGRVQPYSGAGYQWVVRENPHGTGSWQTVDTFQYASGKEAWAIAATADALGHVFVGGRAQDANGTYHWIVRNN